MTANGTLEMAAAPKPVHPVSDTVRRIGVTALMLAPAMATSYVPAPGIEPDQVASALKSLDTETLSMSRLSITPLWLSPFLYAFIAVEALKFAFPGFGPPAHSGPARRAAFHRYVLILAFAMATFQAMGIAVAFETVSGSHGTALVSETGIAFRLSYMMTILGGFALLCVLAEAITRFGVGSGYWILVGAAALASLPDDVWQITQSHKYGQISISDMLVLPLVIILSIAALAGLWHRFVAIGHCGKRDGLGDAEDILIPILLAISFAQAIFGLSALLAFVNAQPGDVTATSAAFVPLRLALGTVLAFFIAYVRHTRNGDGEPLAWLFIAASTSAIAVAFDLLSAKLNIQDLGLPIIAMTLALLAFRDRRPIA